MNDQINNLGTTGVAGTPTATPTAPLAKKHDKQVIAIVVLAVICCAGIGFGIFGMVKSGQANQRSEILSGELEQKDEALRQVEEKLGAQVEIEDSAKDGDEKEEIASVNVSAARDYIYVGNWGIKIKVPDNLTALTYTFMQTSVETLYITAAVGGQMLPTFVENMMHSGSGLVAIGRYAKNDLNISAAKIGDEVMDDGIGIGEVVYMDNDYVYLYSHAQMLMGTESEKQWELDSVNALEQMVRTGISAF